MKVSCLQVNEDPIMNPTYRRLASLLSTAMLVVLAAAGRPASADDTEIFVAEPPPGANTAANIMFIIDTSGSMEYQCHNPGDLESQYGFQWQLQGRPHLLGNRESRHADLLGWKRN